MEPEEDVFAPLNGMRGIAAIAVVLYHASPFFSVNFAPRGYLAVDLFFVLSGFVIAHAYDRRFAAGLRPSTFLWQRIKRFYPLYLLGHLIAAGWIALELIVSPPAIFTPMQLLIATAVGGLFLPAPFGEDLYPLNVPAWSLLWELVINFAFAAIWKRTGLLVLLSASCWLAIVLATGTGQLDRGAADLMMGALRAGFSFPLGLMIYRHRKSLPQVRISPLVTMAGVAVTLVVPMIDLVIVTFAFPLAIVLLSRCDQRDRRAFAALGALSFPLYATHYPILRAGLGLSKWLPLPSVVVGAGCVVFAVLFALLADRYVDRPARQWIQRRRHRVSEVGASG